MKRTLSLLAVILLFFAVFWRLDHLTPSTVSDAQTPAGRFSAERALEHIKKISGNPHYVGSVYHDSVRNYISEQLKALGLDPEIQEGSVLGYGNNLIFASNIVARIKGKLPGRSLILMSHYDSNPHSSFGASDAGSGVAVILEGVRAYLESGKTPVNDIVILFTDGEELGLNGAKLFVENSGAYTDPGIVLNFEARGSGGPGIMLLETNRGNKNLIESFREARTPYPLTNSLFYSIYKLLPNDTDLTVFRQEADINGYNFAFIDDHFDYHTALDTYDRLDRRTLEHQGSYLMPLLDYFSGKPVSTLKSDTDLVFFDFPFAGIISYPFAYIMPLTIFAVLVFIVLLFYGLSKKRLHFKILLTGFVPLLISLLLAGGLCYFFWPLLKMIYPVYGDILQGFPYTGYYYIAAAVCLTLAICFRSYSGIKAEDAASLMFAPVLFWLVLCILLSIYLKGASFFIITTGFSLLAWWVMIRQKEPNPLLMLLLILPALWIYAPMIRLFPVALGMPMLFAASVLTTLVFAAALPVLAFAPSKRLWSILFVLMFVGNLVVAHLNSGTSANRPYPSSLIYLQDQENQKAYLATYNKTITPWLGRYLQEANTNDLMQEAFSSKYRTPLTLSKEVPSVRIPGPVIEKITDTLIGNKRHITLLVQPQRKVHRMEVFLKGGGVEQAFVNGKPLYPVDPDNGTKRLFTHFISNDPQTKISFILPQHAKREFIFYEASHDLLTWPALHIEDRPENEIPMPFILNDAIITKTTLDL